MHTFETRTHCVQDVISLRLHGAETTTVLAHFHLKVSREWIEYVYCCLHAHLCRHCELRQTSTDMRIKMSERT